MSYIKTQNDYNYIRQNKYLIDVWNPKETEIIMGRFCVEENDIKRNAYKDGISIKRRPGGGGTVLLDNGVLVVDIGILNYERKKTKYFFEKFNNIIINVFKKHVGIQLEYDKEFYDLKYDNKKIAGVSLAVSNNIVLYGTSILLRKDTIKKIDRYIKEPLKRPKYRGNRNHKDFLISLEEIKKFDSESLLKILKKEIEVHICRK